MMRACSDRQPTGQKSKKALTRDQHEALTQGQRDKTSQLTSHTLTHTGGDLTACARVCEKLNLKVDDPWLLRVVAHFLVPAERCLQVRTKHRACMPDLVTCLAGHASKTLEAGAARIIRERSVFPTIAQADAACAAASKMLHGSVRISAGSKAHQAWLAYLAAHGTPIALKLFKQQPQGTVERNLLDEVVAIYGEGSDQ